MTPRRNQNQLFSNLVQGENPALNLVDSVNKSKWARLYPNKLKTFEYDLAMEADNLKVLVPVAKSLVLTNGPIKDTYEKYERTDWQTAMKTKRQRLLITC